MSVVVEFIADAFSDKTYDNNGLENSCFRETFLQSCRTIIILVIYLLCSSKTIFQFLFATLFSEVKKYYNIYMYIYMSTVTFQFSMPYTTVMIMYLLEHQREAGRQFVPSLLSSECSHRMLREDVCLLLLWNLWHNRYCIALQCSG